MNSKSKSLVFHYVKGPDFRTTHTDGIIGSVTPQGYIHMSLFSERPAIPKSITFSLEENGALGDELKRETKGGIVRQMEVDLFFNEQTAKNMRDWLDNRISELSKLSSVKE